MTMKQYESYKPSGTPWIGDIPSHWEKKRLRFVCEFRNGYTPSKTNQNFWTDGTIPWYRMDDIRDSGRFLNESKQYVTEEAVKGQGLFEAGSFILATTATIGEHAMLIVDSQANQRFTNLKIRKSLEHSCHKEFFFYYLFLIDEFCKSSTRTATFPAMDMEDLRNFDVAIPPLAEQEAIATYLDRKCESIDKAIATQERRITLLTELKQSIITEAVTRGLNPDAPLKDSGIDWIGQIPEHWEVRRIKTLSPVKRGASPRPIEDSKYFDDNGDYAWVRIADVSASDKYLLSTEQTLSELGSSLSVKREPGDIFISIAGTVGKPIITKIKCCIHDGFVWFPNLKFYNELLFYIFLSGRPYLGLGKWGTQLNLNTDTIGCIHIPVPPMKEQESIVQRLEKKLQPVDSAIAKAKREIDLLREFKQSVITEAVTGKIKVC